MQSSVVAACVGYRKKCSSFKGPLRMDQHGLLLEEL